MKRLFAVLLVTLALGGCATQELGPGVTGERIEQVGSGPLHLVTFVGDSHTTPEFARNYVLYRSAELAQSHNKPFFILYDSLSNAANDRPIARPVTGIVYGSPTVRAFVLLLDAQRPGARWTSAVLADLKKTVVSGKPEQPANGQDK